MRISTQTKNLLVSGSYVGLLATCLLLSAAQATEKSSHKTLPAGENKAQTQKPSLSITRQYAMKVFDQVDKLVSKEFYSEELAKTKWPIVAKEKREHILASKTLDELDERINEALGELHSSHTEFVTKNDEIFYFLHSLFGSMNPKFYNPLMDFTGAITGGVKKERNQIRYVLEDSPAAKAGLQRNDIIESVDGQPYVGQANFWNKAGKKVSLSILRGSKSERLSIVPVKLHDYDGYVKALSKSVRVEKTPQGTIGYMHYWAGGTPSHTAFEEAMEKTLVHTDGLILDCRDGYGGNSADDLEMLYRQRAAYPVWTTKDRKGKVRVSQDFYDKPVVAIINGGVRSGRELLAFGLKRSKRATLVGEKTAGMVLAGRLWPIDKNCSLYLAVLDIKEDDERLEGNGVAPDVEVAQDGLSSGPDKQLETARSMLLERLGTKQ